MEREITLEDLGYCAFFADAWGGYKDGDGYSLARVTSEHKEAYTVRDAEREYFATVTGKRMFEAESREAYPAVGDWVVIEKTANDKATIHHILPRKTVLKRKHAHRDVIQIMATNVDYAFVVEALGRDYSLNRFERYFVLAREGGVVPVAVLNKTDLISLDEAASAVMEVQARFPGVAVLTTSAESNEGLSALADFLEKGKTYCFLGSSGVGKSSLINTLLGNSEIAVQEIGEHSKRGKHTTTKREMYVLPGGGVVIDNPGTREVGVVEAVEGAEAVFDDILLFADRCKFGNCSHEHEPGCAVLEALQGGEIDEEKYENFLRIRRENEHYEMTDFERRTKDRQFGKMVKHVMEEKGRREC